jgi:hypothetical protein
MSGSPRSPGGERGLLRWAYRDSRKVSTASRSALESARLAAVPPDGFLQRAGAAVMEVAHVLRAALHELQRAQAPQGLRAPQAGGRLALGQRVGRQGLGVQVGDDAVPGAQAYAHHVELLEGVVALPTAIEDGRLQARGRGQLELVAHLQRAGRGRAPVGGERHHAAAVLRVADGLVALVGVVEAVVERPAVVAHVGGVDVAEQAEGGAPERAVVDVQVHLDELLARGHVVADLQAEGPVLEVEGGRRGGPVSWIS